MNFVEKGVFPGRTALRWGSMAFRPLTKVNKKKDDQQQEGLIFRMYA
jgi:hypothetical protein